jgi:hypothetical protein
VPDFVAHPVGWFAVFAEHFHDGGMVFKGSHGKRPNVGTRYRPILMDIP